MITTIQPTQAPPLVTQAKQRPTTPKRPTRPSTRLTSPTPTTTPLYDLSEEDGKLYCPFELENKLYILFQNLLDEDEEVTIPGTVREEFPPKRVTVKPYTPVLNGHASNTNPLPPLIVPQTPILKVKPLPPSTTTTTTTKNPQNVILAAHPQDNEIAGSVNIRSDQSPNVNIPYILENDPTSKESQGAKLNLGAIVALGAFGGFVFLAAVITTIVILVRRLVNFLCLLYFSGDWEYIRHLIHFSSFLLKFFLSFL